jgi:hypothetical protein
MGEQHPQKAPIDCNEQPGLRVLGEAGRMARRLSTNVTVG